MWSSLSLGSAPSCGHLAQYRELLWPLLGRRRLYACGQTAIASRHPCVRVRAYKKPARRVAFPQRQKHQFQNLKQPTTPIDAPRLAGVPGGGPGKPPPNKHQEQQQQHLQQQELQRLRRAKQTSALAKGEHGEHSKRRGQPAAAKSRPLLDDEQPVASTSGAEPSSGAAQQQQQQQRSKQHAKQHASQTPKTARDWQATRDWLIMSMEETLMDDETFASLAEELDLEEAWRPQVSLLWKLGMSRAQLSKLLDSRLYVLKLGVPTLRCKLQFLRTAAGLDDSDICRLLVKFPRILEYKTEKTIRSHLDFFVRHGVDQSELPKVVMRAPQLLELSIPETLTPRIRFLTETAAIPSCSIGKLITRHPQVMTCTEEGMSLRVRFLERLGLDRQAIGKAVLAHPQILHYSVTAMEQRIAYMQSIGMSESQLAIAVARLPQLFSLDVRNNMAPKYDYLVQQLGGSVATLSSYPAYLSLSLSNRIIPRHKFLEVVTANGPKQLPRPFPMSYLKCSDKKFAHDVAGSSLQRFEAFRSQLGPQTPQLSRRA